MADLNALIAQGAQFRVPPPVDPMGNMPQLMQMQALQQQNQMNQMKMQEAQRGQQEMNALRGLMSSPGFDLSTPASQRKVYEVAPTQAENIIKGHMGNVKIAADVERTGVENEKDRRKFVNDSLSDLSFNPSAENVTAWSQDAVLKKHLTSEQAAARKEFLLAMPDETRKIYLAQQGASSADTAKLFEPKPIERTDGQTKWTEESNPRLPGFGKRIAGAADISMKAPPSAPTDLARLQDERAKLMPGDPRIAQYDAAIRKATTFAPSPQVTVKLPALETAELKGKGELNVKQYGAVSDAARLATKTLPSLDIQSNILDKGFKTGFGTDAQKAGASVLASLGIPEAARFATDAQTFLASTQKVLLDRQLEQKGPQTANDAQRIEQTGAQLGNTPEANRFLIDVAKGQYKRDIEQRNFFDKWWTQNKTYEGAEDAWYAGDGGKSLFDRPELKKYAPKAAGAMPAATKSGATVSNWKQ